MSFISCILTVLLTDQELFRMIGTTNTKIHACLVGFMESTATSPNRSHLYFNPPRHSGTLRDYMVCMVHGFLILINYLKG